VRDWFYPRDLIGYGRNPPHADWPGGARIAVQFVLNYEEGGENCVLHGDAGSEQFLSEIIGAAAYPARHLSMESIYEYGSRVGGWRILDEFARRGLPLTVFGVGMAMQRHPDFIRACVEAGHEIASHGWRWIHYQNLDEATERAHLLQAVAIHRELTGAAPLGWYTGRDSPNTRRLVVEHGGFEYDSDYYGDDLPFWTEVDCRDGSQRRTCRALHAGRQRHALRHAAGLQHRDPLLRVPARQLRRALRRGRRASAHAVHRHALPLARPPRALPRTLQRFLDHIEKHDRVWVCRASTSRGTGPARFH
jgi:allantoinase